MCMLESVYHILKIFSSNKFYKEMQKIVDFYVVKENGTIKIMLHHSTWCRLFCRVTTSHAGIITSLLSIQNA